MSGQPKKPHESNDCMAMNEQVFMPVLVVNYYGIEIHPCPICSRRSVLVLRNLVPSTTGTARVFGRMGLPAMHPRECFRVVLSRL